MKTNTLKSRKGHFPNKGYITALALIGYGICNAQVQNNNSIYVGNNANFYVAAGNYNFGPSPATTQTSKLAASYGVLSFSATAIANGANDSHYLNGYARTYGTTQAILPVGDGGFYAPVAVTPSASTGVDAAYFRASALTVGAAKAASVNLISTTEYWNVKSSGANSRISLTWRATSGIAYLTNGSLSNLTILGWNGSQWVNIASTVDVTSILGGVSNFTAGSISTNASVALSAYSAFTIGSKVEDCATLIASSGNTRTWNASWSVAPTLADPVTINSAYNGGSFSCNSYI